MPGCPKTTPGYKHPGVPRQDVSKVNGVVLRGIELEDRALCTHGAGWNHMAAGRGD